MSRYELRSVGVFDRELGRVIGRGDGAWQDYRAWVAAGNVPAPGGASERSIDARRADALVAVNAARARAIAGGLTFEGHRYDTDEAGRANVTAVIAAVSAGIALPANFTWRTANNLDVPMDAATLLALGAAMLEHVERCYRRSWGLKQAIEVAGEPESIDIAGGWSG